MNFSSYRPASSFVWVLGGERPQESFHGFNFVVSDLDPLCPTDQFFLLLFPFPLFLKVCSYVSERHSDTGHLVWSWWLGLGQVEFRSQCVAHRLPLCQVRQPGLTLVLIGMTVSQVAASSAVPQICNSRGPLCSSWVLVNAHCLLNKLSLFLSHLHLFILYLPPLPT